MEFYLKIFSFLLDVFISPVISVNIFENSVNIWPTNNIYAYLLIPALFLNENQSMSSILLCTPQKLSTKLLGRFRIYSATKSRSTAKSQHNTTG